MGHVEVITPAFREKRTIRADDVTELGGFSYKFPLLVGFGPRTGLFFFSHASFHTGDYEKPRIGVEVLVAVRVRLTEVLHILCEVGNEPASRCDQRRHRSHGFDGFKNDERCLTQREGSHHEQK